jgi:hypothetical protein
MAEQLTGVMVHARIQGRSIDVPFKALDLGPLPSDAEVKRALAQFLNLAPAQLRDYVVDRHETGNLTVRPEAVFG